MKIRINLNIIILFMIILYFNKLNTYFIILLFTLMHEVSHMLVGLIFGYKIEKLEFSIIGLSIKFKSKIEGYNKKVLYGNMNNLENIGISLAGPIFNFLVVLVILYGNVTKIINYNFNFELLVYINLMIGLFNLIPIYPLDGYIIVSNLLGILIGNIKGKTYVYYISNIIMFVITVASSILILQYKNIWIFIILVFLYYLNIRENKRYFAKIRLYKNYEKLKKYI